MTAALVAYGNAGNGNNGNNGNGNGNQDKPTGSDVKKTSTVVKQFVVDFSSETYKPLMEHEVNGLDYRYVYSDKARLSVVVQGIENGSASLLDDKGELHAYYHCDYLGTTDYLTSAVNSKVISWTSYSEWGEITHNAVLKCGQRELDLVKEYATHDFDAVLNMYYAKARFYDADNRRFTAVDPILDPSRYTMRQYVTDPMQLVQYLYVKNNAVNWIDPLGLVTAAEYNNLLGRIRKSFNSNSFLDDVYEVVKKSSSERNMMFHVFTQIYVAREILLRHPDARIQFEKPVSNEYLSGRIDVLATVDGIQYPFEIKPKYANKGDLTPPQIDGYREEAAKKLSTYYRILSCEGTKKNVTVEVTGPNSRDSYENILPFKVLFDKVIFSDKNGTVRLRIEHLDKNLPGYVTYQVIYEDNFNKEKNKIQMPNIQFSYRYEGYKNSEQKVYEAIDNQIYKLVGKHATELTQQQLFALGFATGTVFVVGTAAAAWATLSATEITVKAASGAIAKITPVKCAVKGGNVLMYVAETEADAAAAVAAGVATAIAA